LAQVILILIENFKRGIKHFQNNYLLIFLPIFPTALGHLGAPPRAPLDQYQAITSNIIATFTVLKAINYGVNIQ